MTARKVFAWGWVAVVGGTFLAATASDLAGDDAQVVGLIGELLIALSFPIAGALILSHHPRHTIGWILSLGGIYMFAEGSSELIEGWLSGSAVTWLTWVGQVFWAPTFLSLISLLPLLFPTGHLLSRRWRWALTCAVIGLAGLTLANALDPALLEYHGLHNPTANPAGFDEGPLMLGSGMVLIIAVLAGVASLIVRYRRARNDERNQIHWLMLAMIVAVLGWLAAIGIDAASSAKIGSHIFAFSLLGLPSAIAVAVLKYRLYDIDVVISRSLVFAGLAGFITAIYVGIVVGVGTLLGAGGEPNLGLSMVATAVVAVAFQPVRERLTRLANRLVFGKRATPYEVLSRFSSHLGETVATEDTLERMARLLADGTGAAHAQVSLAIGGQTVPAASVGQVTDASAEAHTIEVTHQGETLGALSVTKKRGETLTPADVKLVDDLAAQAGLLLRNVRLTEELKARIVDLRASRQRLVAAQDAERRRLERDLHDGAQRQLLGLKSRLAGAGSTATEEQAVKAAQILEQVIADADDAVATLRELAHGIFPPLLAAEGLAGALRAHAAKAAVPVVVEPDGIGRYSQEVEAAVYFCVLEAIQNAAKYANPSLVTIRLAEHDGQLTFEVTDDGVGFDPATTAKGHGTTNMTDRLEALGGQLATISSPGAGTRIAGALPAKCRSGTALVERAP